MHNCFSTDDTAASTPLWLVTRSGYDPWLARQQQRVKNWVEGTGFEPEAGRHCLVPDADGRPAAVLVGAADERDMWTLGRLPDRLPAGRYRIDGAQGPQDKAALALGWGLGAYRFERYKKPVAKPAPQLVLAGCADPQGLAQTLTSLCLVRDLINTPAQDMMPRQLGQAATDLAAAFGAQLRQIVGDELLRERYPAVHAVGRASAHAPRLLDLTWGDENHPRLTLVGKGVCFDSGGLDLKPAKGMRLMKKDMGGAAHVLGLARLVMAARLPVRLRVLVAAVENAVSGDAMRPGDVLASRQGLSIEIDNTDAEGRLVLCDALAEAAAESPDLVVDFSTLTGAARVALGTEIAVFFSNSDSVAAGLQQGAEQAQDPVWRLPLHRPYRSYLDSAVADLRNASSEPYGGAITAALFLQEFMPATTEWVHFDVMAWNTRTRPGRPRGGEAMGVRAVFGYLGRRYRA